MTDGAIVCEGLVRIFTAQNVEVQALQGLDLRMATGDMVALVGASGSGKSTLLGILAGLDQPTAGAARVAGHDLVTMKGAERLAYRRSSVGFVWQQSARNLLPYLTARENIAMVHDVAGVVPRAERASVGDELLELLDAVDVSGKRPAQMSGGQRQRVAIAVALANRPRVLLADEPTGELDEQTSAEVLHAMESVNRERGVTTLIVTHDTGVTEHVERTVRIRDGRTSTETLRSDATDHQGRTVRTAQEYALLDRAGRMQLPADFVAALDLRERVRLSLEPDHVRIAPGQDAPGSDKTTEEA
ncbi:ABC transporter ATP-binding protein [Microbacterium sp. NPDC089318]